MYSSQSDEVLAKIHAHVFALHSFDDFIISSQKAVIHSPNGAFCYSLLRNKGIDSFAFADRLPIVHFLPLLVFHPSHGIKPLLLGGVWLCADADVQLAVVYAERNYIIKRIMAAPK